MYAWAKASSKPSYAWNEITGKPGSFTPSGHTHTKSQITDFPNSLPASDVYSWAKASSKPSYAWSEITGLGDVLPLQHFVTGINLTPKALNTEYKYTNAALIGKKCIVAIFYSSVGNVFVTSYTSSRGVLNVKDGDQYWGGEVSVGYDSSSGTVKFTVVWIGSSQPIGNFALTDVLY